MADHERPPRLHRNNAAEWAMVIALTPVAWVVRLWGRMRHRRRRERAELAAERRRPRRSLRVEGLPPRTMN